MDHLPLPSQPTIGALPIPFLCDKEYDGGPFESYPSRIGWDVQYTENIAFLKGKKEVLNDLEIGSFIQTWLYIGLLSDVTSSKLPMRLFLQQVNHDDRLFSSACLESIIGPWSEQMTKAEWASEPYKLNEWQQGVLDRLEIAQDICTRLAEAREDLENAETSPLLLIILSIAVLWEYIAQALKQIYISHELEPAPRAAWRFSTDECSRPLRDLMKRHGWCPNKMSYFEASEGASNGLLWYYANIDPPEAPDNHRDCTNEQCNSLQVDLQNYQTLHVHNGCSCEFVVSPAKELATVIRSETIALVSLEGSVLKVIKAKPDAEFVAISHVWADGFGNRNQNALPMCVIQYIQASVNKLHNTSHAQKINTLFWIDTLCLPRQPKELRKRALAKMDSAYKNATKVLVLDSYLRTLRAGSMGPIELIARVKSSRWISRLWTFLEGRLSQDLWFQFRDEAVSVFGKANEWRQQYHGDVPALASHEVEISMIANYTASKIMVNDDESTDIEIPFMRITMSTRSTSRAADEAFCLAGILGLDVKTIIEAEDADRMRVLWSLMSKIPASLVFSTAEEKIDAAGCRWAPSSFMGGATKDVAAWTGPDNLWEHKATKASHGLEVSLPGLLFGVESGHRTDANTQFAKSMLLEGVLPERHRQSRDPMSHITFQCSRGKWYDAYLEEDWHQTLLPVSFENEIPALILSHSLYSSRIKSTVRTTNFDYADHLYGVLVTYPRNSNPKDSVVMARVQRHVQVHLWEEKRQKLMESIQKCARELMSRYGEKVEKLRKKDQDKLVDRLKPWVRKLAKKSELWQRCKEVLIDEGEDSGDRFVLSKCLQLVYYLIWMGDWYLAEEPEKPILWCID